MTFFRMNAKCQLVYTKVVVCVPSSIHLSSSSIYQIMYNSIGMSSHTLSTAEEGIFVVPIRRLATGLKIIAQI